MIVPDRKKTWNNVVFHDTVEAGGALQNIRSASPDLKIYTYPIARALRVPSLHAASFCVCECMGVLARLVAAPRADCRGIGARRVFEDGGGRGIPWEKPPANM